MDIVEDIILEEETETFALAPLAVPPPSPMAGTGTSVYLSSSWHLVGTWGLHADRVWSEYNGAGVMVTALDDGFQSSHPVFAGNYRVDLSRDLSLGINNGANPVYAGENHGTATLSEIIGVGGSMPIGVAWGAQGFGMRMNFSGSGAEILQGFQYAQSAGAAVMNNSWGYNDDFIDDFSNIYFAAMANVIKNYADNGRGGLGGIIVFSAGNGRHEGDNTNYHNLTNSPYTIAVGAIDESGKAAWFSTPGASVLVTAAGVDVLTADRTGTAGYSSGNVTSFAGTSASAPLVSGTAALMLQANSSLGWRDVQEILAYSAQHNDPTSTGWQYNDAVNWNGGGLHFSHDYGFGAVDAYTAVRLAESWTTTKVSANMTSVTTATISPALSFSAVTGTSTINVAQNINIERILINLDISKSSMQDLYVTLTGPGGTQSVLVDGADYGTGTARLKFQFSTVANWGETSAGAWTLSLTDVDGGSGGTLNSWSLKFLGSAVSVDNTYIYTDAFADFSGGALAARSTINDANGGVDMLNLSAVSTGVTVNLSTGSATISGHAVNIGANAIENVYSGDGNDSLTGGAASNKIYGGRGSDSITASAGNDTLDGGAGMDTLIYGAAFSDFQVALIGTGVLKLTDTLGVFGEDIARRIENFVFSGVSYTLQQLTNYAQGNVQALLPPLDNIIVSFSSKAVISSTTMGLRTYTSADFGAKTTTPWVEVSRDENGIVLSYLGAAAPAKVSISTGADDSIALIGTAPITLKANIVLGNGDADVNVEVRATLTVNAGHGDNTVAAGAGKTTIVAGEGDNNITVTSITNKVTLGGGDNIVSAGTGKNTITATNGNNEITSNGADKITVGHGDNVISGGHGADRIVTGDGDNHITVTSGNNKIAVGHGQNVITTGTGTDTVTLGNGGNTVYLGGGLASIKGGLGADTFIFNAAGGGVDKIGRFNAIEGDKIDISNVLSYSDPLSQAIGDFVSISSKGVISIDADGADNGVSFVALATVKGFTITDVDLLVQSGALVVT